MINRVKSFCFSEIIKSNDFEEAIDICIFFESIINTNFLKIYDCYQLEELMHEKFLKKLNIPIYEEGGNKRNALHIISEGYKTGGHTRLMERLAAMHNSTPSLLVSRSDAMDHSNLFDNVYINNNKNYLDSFIYMLRIVSLFEVVILHINPDDILVALVVRYLRNKNKNFKVYFVNHADHQFSYGRKISDVILEIGAFGPYLQKNMGFYHDSSFLGIPIDFHKDEIKKNDVICNEIFTAGASWKYKPIGKFSLQKKIYKILLKNKSLKFTVIGVKPLVDYWWWFLKLRFPTRVSLIKSLPYNQYLKIFKSNKIYLDSFPITGGTAFAEAMLKGCFVVGLDTVLSGFTPLDLNRVSDEKEILEIIKNPNKHMEINNSLITDILSFHDFENVKRRYMDAFDGKFSICPLGVIDNAVNYPSLCNRNYFFKINFSISSKYYKYSWVYKFHLFLFFYVSPKVYLKIVLNFIKNLSNLRVFNFGNR